MIHRWLSESTLFESVFICENLWLKKFADFSLYSR